MARHKLKLAPPSLLLYNAGALGESDDWQICHNGHAFPAQGIEMSPTQIRVIGAGLFYLVTFVSGWWLSRSGKPYGPAQLAIHKLVSVAALVYLAVVAFQVDQLRGIGPIAWLAVAVTGVPFLVMMATGGLLSTDKLVPSIVIRPHQVTPYLTLVCTALTMQFLLGCVL